eukprot:1358410-Prymnesium_polylepis.1
MVRWSPPNVVANFKDTRPTGVTVIGRWLSSRQGLRAHASRALTALTVVFALRSRARPRCTEGGPAPTRHGRDIRGRGRVGGDAGARRSNTLERLYDLVCGDSPRHRQASSHPARIRLGEGRVRPGALGCGCCGVRVFRVLSSVKLVKRQSSSKRHPVPDVNVSEICHRSYPANERTGHWTPARLTRRANPSPPLGTCSPPVSSTYPCTAAR